MSLDEWSKAEERDATHAKRMVGSSVAAMIVIAAVLGVGIAFGGQIKKQVFEEEVDVKFVPPEPVKAPPPPPPPPPPPAPRIASHAAPPPKGNIQQDAPPTELPKAPPEEGDPNKPREEGTVGDANGVVGGTGRGGPYIPAPPAPPAPPEPPPAPLVQVAEVSTAPIPVSKAMPAYPEEARKQGIEALVVVKFIVTETGAVEDLKIVKGHPLFDEVVLETVRGWTFQPATLEGKAVRMARMVKIPFRLKHS